MTDKPKSSWFQFHLSTVIIATLMTGGFIGLNFVVEHPPFDDWDGLDEVIGDGFVVSKTSFGFPFSIYNVRVWREPSSVQGGIVFFGVILNLVTLACAIFVANVLFGWWIRLSRRRNEPKS